MLDLIIKNGTLVTPDAIFDADIEVKDEKIVSITVPGTAKEAAKIIDAKDKYVMPGLIDPHMHVNAPLGGYVDILNHYQASKIAAYGGVTTFIDFSNTTKGDNVLDAIKRRREEMEHSCIDFGIHAKFVEANAELLHSIKDIIDYGCPSFKMFMTYRKAGVMIDDTDLLKVMEEANKWGGLCGFHAESNPIAEYNEEKFEREGKLDWKYFPESKPVVCEAEAVGKVIHFAEYLNASIFLFHQTSASAVDLIRKAKERGVKVIGETCTHYLTLTKEKNNGPDGFLYLMSPPLREKKDQEALWNGLNEGILSLVSSDNCTFTKKLKEAGLERDANGNIVPDFRKPINGVSGLEERFGLMMGEGVNKGRISLNKFVELCCTNPAKVFGMYPQKGCLNVGSDADIILIDPEKTVQLSKDNLHYGLDYSIFDEFESKGWPVTTIRRGEVIVEGGKFYGKEGTGRFIKRVLKR